MMNFLKKFSLEVWVKICVLLFLFSLFFPIRYVFLSPSSYLTGNYSDFTSFSLYLSDILLFIAFFLTLWLNKNNILSVIRGQMSIVIFIFWLILALFLAKNLISGLNIYYFIKFFEFTIVAYGTTYITFSKFDLKLSFFRIFALFCGFQSIIALSQFAKQTSLGLYKIGESHLSPNILGVAKIVSNGTTYIRSYGTFPHPNLLSAFLVAGILITIWLILQSTTKKTKISYSLVLFLNILGLTVAFSRGAYLALGVGLIVFFGSPSLWRHPEWSEGSPKKDSSALPAFKMMPFLVTLTSIVISFFLFHPFLLTRATFTDQSTIDRKFYDQMGLKMTTSKPFFGVGMGESLLHMEQISKKTLKPWEKQPPHNFFIVAAAELGIPGALILLWVFLSSLIAISYKLKASFTAYHLLLISLLACALILMMFDHYFYTLQQTQMLLWVILGIIAAETRPQPATAVSFGGESKKIPNRGFVNLC